MVNSKTSDLKQVFISYKDDRDNLVSGFVFLIELKSNYVKIKTNQNILTIPFHRILKIKEKIQNEI